MTKRVLLIAFHFPPLNSSSGLQRPLSLARYLPEEGWQPAVLTASVTAYESIDAGSAAGLPAGLRVVRAPALDAARHLAIRGWYPGWLGIPDRWSSWLLGAVPAGLGLIRRFRPDVIWSTYPLATAHRIGLALHRVTGVPWVADFRDPMVEQIDGEWFPGNARLRGARLRVERLVARHASAATFCTDSARRIYLNRHPARRAGQLAEVIANGFDPEPFAQAEAESPPRQAGVVAKQGLTLVHSGTLYPGPDRDPGAFLAALKAVRSRGALPPGLRVVLRATGFDKTYAPLIGSLDLTDVVELAPPVAYRAALREMLAADGLLLFQGHTSNPAVPAKVYEYLRARRPILALADGAGETAALLRRAGVGRILPIDDPARIGTGLGEFLQGLAAGTEPVLSPSGADEFSRVHRVAEFATLFTRVASP
ncbi:MAG: glycosyltransferase [Chromatiales bacterium]|nr:glycosyltransferase [Chromatiales bacterium]